MLSANHLSNFDPWPLGLPLFPGRFLRFMAKSELFWPPLGWIIHAGGGFRVRRGERDAEAVETATQLCRDGYAVVMFPEGTRRAKGIRKKHEARWHSGAARIALDAGVPLVPAAIRGTDRLARLGPLRVAYGSPIPLDDLPDDPREAAALATDRLRVEIERLEASLTETPARDRRRLVRAPRLPRPTRRPCAGRTAGTATRSAGVMQMVVRLWQVEQPRRCSSAGTRSRSPPTATRRSPSTRQVACSTMRFSSSSICSRRWSAATGIACAKSPGYEADDFLGAAAVTEEARGGTALVATSDRDAFQIASDRTTILQPVRGVFELARIGPAEVRERYGVDPPQVPDFIALRGDPSDKIPGARGVGEKTAASLLAEYGSLDAMLAAGRFATEAEALLLYRRIARFDTAAPLPPLPDLEPDWRAGATAARELGLDALAATPRRALMELVSHPDLARLHPTAHRGHPENEHRIEALQAAFGHLREGALAERDDLERVHDPAYLDRIEQLEDGDRARRGHDRRADELGGGAARRGMCDRGGRGRRLRPRRPPGHHALHDASMGFCLVANVVVAARRAQLVDGVERIAIVDWDVHHGNGTEALVDGDESILFVSLHQWPFWPGPAAPIRATGTSSTSRSRPGRTTTCTHRLPRRSSSRSSPRSTPSS